MSERAARIRLALTDCDGVLTDGGVYYSARGEELKRFSIRDGMGVARLRQVGVDVGIATGEVSAPVRRRAQKLAITELWEGVEEKAAVLAHICERRDLDPAEVAYLGDDHNDLGVLAQVGLAAAPADALPAVRDIVHFVTTEPGGHGAFRAVAELIVAAKTQKGAMAWM